MIVSSCKKNELDVLNARTRIDRQWLIFMSCDNVFVLLEDGIVLGLLSKIGFQLLNDERF